MTNVNNQVRLALADLFIEFLESSDDPRAPVALEFYRKQREQLMVRIESKAVHKNDVAPGEAQIVGLKTLSLKGEIYGRG